MCCVLQKPQNSASVNIHQSQYTGKRIFLLHHLQDNWQEQASHQPECVVPDCGAVCDMLYREIKRQPMIIGKPSTVMINYVTNKFKTNLQFTVIIGGWVIY